LPPTLTPFPYTTLFRSHGDGRYDSHRDGTGLETVDEAWDHRNVIRRRARPWGVQDPCVGTRHDGRFRRYGIHRRSAAGVSCTPRSEEHTSELQSLAYLV